MSPGLKKLVNQFWKPKKEIPSIKAWTFAIYPGLKGTLPGSLQFKRYIVTIDTRMSNIYFLVEEFLRRQTTNVMSYYTGGWADFICDVQLDPVSFQKFRDGLENVLTKPLRVIGEDVQNVISIFEVGKTKLLCGKQIEPLTIPASSFVDDILREPQVFETVHQNYRSPEALDLLGGKTEVRKYLKKLEAKGIIVCYNILFDFPAWYARDYVPMIIGDTRKAPTQIAELLSAAQTDKNLIHPVEELLEIEDVISTEKAEKAVNYFWINTYDHPAARTAWKKSVYETIGVDANLYNYPLEGALNESPIYLSDLAAFVNKANEYTSDKKDKFFIGFADHSSLKYPIEIALPRSGLARHGVTLGEPSSGKTNADMVLVTEAARVLQTVIVLDGSGSVKGKRSALSADLRKKLEIIPLSLGNAAKEIRGLIDSEGFFVLEVPQLEMPEVFSILVQEITSLDDASKGNVERSVKKMFLVEEADQVLGEEGKLRDNVQPLIQLLGKAYRKGWCIWLSTQYPSTLGYDQGSAEQVLRALENRIVLSQTKTPEIEKLIRAFRSEAAFSSDDEEYLRSTVAKLPAGTALCRGVEWSPTAEHHLPLIRTKIRLLEAESDK